MMFFSILHQNMPQKPPKEGVLSHCEATLPHVFFKCGLVHHSIDLFHRNSNYFYSSLT